MTDREKIIQNIAFIHRMRDTLEKVDRLPYSDVYQLLDHGLFLLNENAFSLMRKIENTNLKFDEYDKHSETLL